MKLTVKYKNIGGDYSLTQSTKGDWIDLSVSKDANVKGPVADTLKRTRVNGTDESKRKVSFTYYQLPLGIAMQLPKGFEAVAVPRSSTFKKYGLIMTNSIGVIDNSYCGDDDEWQFPTIACRDAFIEKGSRICQFKIQLSQNATIWQKIKWLLSSGFKFKEVESLDNPNRGGFGSTGVK